MTTHHTHTRSPLFASLGIILLGALGCFGYAPHAEAFFDATRALHDNTFSTASLDIALSETAVYGTTTPTLPATFSVTLTLGAGSGAPNYTVRAENPSGTLCAKLSLEGGEGSATTSAPLASFLSATSSVIGLWQFSATTTAPATVGETCTIELVWSAWRADALLPPPAAFGDEERLTVTLTAADDTPASLGVVLNEILPNPEDGAPGVLGQEFVELYNNSASAVDVFGWSISEMSSATEKFYTIGTSTNANTVADPSGSTIIPAHGFLVLLFHSADKLNNTGDTVRLYNASLVKLDEYGFATTSANDADSDSNATPGTGNAGGGPETAHNEGKSDARIPDGIGGWVDPVPTPGGANVLDVEFVADHTSNEAPDTVGDAHSGEETGTETGSEEHDTQDIEQDATQAADNEVMQKTEEESSDTVSQEGMQGASAELVTVSSDMAESGNAEDRTGSIAREETEPTNNASAETEVAAAPPSE